MKKRIIAIAVMAVMALGVLSLTACTESLADYKVTGKALIDAHVATKTQNDYITEKWAELLNVAAEGKQAVEDATNKGAVDTAVNDAKMAIDEVKEEREMADFVLTISVENTTLPQGQDFKVTIELKNQSRKDAEIAFEYTHPSAQSMTAGTPFFQSHIEGWRAMIELGVDMMPGEANFATIIKDGTYRSEKELGSMGRNSDFDIVPLSKGTHDLRFSATFSLNWGTENQQEIIIWSNAIKLTVI